MATETEKKTLYTSESLTKMFGDQLRQLRKFDSKKLAKAIENRLELGEESLPKGFAGLFKFNVPILQADLKPYIYEDKFGRGAAPTDTYFVQSNGYISAIIKIIGQDTCIGPIDDVPEHIHVFTIEELQSKINETISIFQGEIDRLKAEEAKKDSTEHFIKMNVETEQLIHDAKSKMPNA